MAGKSQSGAKSRSGSKAGSKSVRAKVAASRGSAMQSPAQRAQVTDPRSGPVDQKAVREAEDHQERLRAGREAKAQAQARGASEADANRIFQEAYDNPDKFDIPPPVGSEEERKLLEEAGRNSLGSSKVKARESGDKSGSKRGKGRAKAKGKAANSASQSSKAEQAGEHTTTEGKGEPSI